MVYFRLFAPLLLVIGLFACRHDAHDATDTGVRTIDSSLPHEVFRARLVAAIADNGLRVLDGACGKCSIKLRFSDNNGTFGANPRRVG